MGDIRCKHIVFGGPKSFNDECDKIWAQYRKDNEESEFSRITFLGVRDRKELPTHWGRYAYCDDFEPLSYVKV